jgi:hypothetical protein
VATIVQHIQAQTGAPPPLILRFLANLLHARGEQAVLAFVQAPPQVQAQALRAFEATVAGPGAAPVPYGPQAGPPQGPPPMPMQGGANGPGGIPLPGNPGGQPAGPGVPGMGGPPPVGPMGMMPHPAELPPNVHPLRQPAQPREQAPVKAKEPKWTPWQPPDLDKVNRNNPWAKRAPTWDEVQEFAERAERFWEPRQRMIAEQQRIIYRRPVFEAADGTPINPAEGEIIHMRSKPARDFERYVSLSEPTQKRIRLQMKPRVAQVEAIKDAAQLVENYLRDQWARDEEAWGERASLGDAQPPLSRKIAYLLAAQGGIAWCYVWNDGPNQEAHPYIMVPIPWSEVYPLQGEATARITRLPLAEARAAYPEINKAYPRKSEDKRPANYPADEAMVRLIGWGDVWGAWWCLAWDFEGGLPKRDSKRREQQRWIVPPQPIKYGFPFYRIQLYGATGAPALDDDKDERVRMTARGVLADRLGDIRIEDQFISAMATGAVKSIDPPGIGYLDPDVREVDEATGRIVPPEISTGIGKRSWLGIHEKYESIDASVTASRDMQGMLQMLGGDDADASPAVLAGRDAAPSGFARALGQEAASALIIDPLERATVSLLTTAFRDRVTLTYRALDEGLLTAITVPGNNGDQTLTAKDLGMAGPETVVSYRNENLAERLQLADFFIKLIHEGIIDKNNVRDELGLEEPERIEQAILRDKALELPPFQEALIEREIEATRDPWILDKFQRALARVQGPPPPQPGLASSPGVPPSPGGTGPPPPPMLAPPPGGPQGGM